MIQKKIWQTYRVPYDQLPDYARRAAETWQELNPDWEYHYLSDEDVLDFVQLNFGSKFVDIFQNKCPVGVMRADIWRVMAVYINGGIYTDLDTYCKAPIDSWLKEWDDKRVVLNAEHEVHINQWTFLSERGHPLMEYILEKMQQGFENPDYTNPHFVHELTGPGVFTKSTLEFLGIWMPKDSMDGEIYKSDPWANQNMHDLNLITQTHRFNDAPRSQELGVFLVPRHRFFHHEVSEHVYGSQIWSDGNYVQWIKERGSIE